MVAFWAVGLAAVALGMQAVERRYDNLLDLALAMSGFIGGPLLAGVAMKASTGARSFTGKKIPGGIPPPDPREGKSDGVVFWLGDRGRHNTTSLGSLT